MLNETVTVMGLGLQGISIAALLATNGVRVCAVDAARRSFDDITAATDEASGLQSVLTEAVATGRLKLSDTLEAASSYVFVSPAETGQEADTLCELYEQRAIELAPLLAPGDLLLLSEVNSSGIVRRVTDAIVTNRPDLAPPGAEPLVHVAILDVSAGSQSLLSTLSSGARTLGANSPHARLTAHQILRRIGSGPIVDTDTQTAELAAFARESRAEADRAYIRAITAASTKAGADRQILLDLTSQYDESRRRQATINEIVQAHGAGDELERQDHRNPSATLRPLVNDELHEANLAPPQPLITVVVAAYMSRHRIRAALKSLHAQTLNPHHFEVLIVINGPDDGTADYVELLRARLAPVRIRTVVTPLASASRAYNLGIDLAAGEYITFVDDDDFVSPHYLERLLEKARPRTIVMAPFGDLTPGSTGPNFDNYINRSIFRFAGSETTLGNLPQAAAANCGKLVHREAIGSVRFDTALRSGQDVIFWTNVIAGASLTITPVLPAAGAVYYRAVRHDSISRKLTYEYCLDRLRVIHLLTEIVRQVPPFATVIRGLKNSQGLLIGKYLEAHPGDREKLLEEIRRQGFDYFPYSQMNMACAKTLVVSYAFPPFNDTSAMVIARRVNAAAEAVDVISQNMSNIRGRDEFALELVREHVGKHVLLGGAATFAHWPTIESYVKRGYESALPRLNAGQYSVVYSRSMLPASHFLGALIKIRHPEITWLAEFSDPMRHDSSGTLRVGEIPESKLFDELQADLLRGFPDAPATRNLWAAVEDLAFGLADRVLLTNHNQLRCMIAAAPRSYRARLETIAEVERHPTLPSKYYEAATASYELPNDRVNLGYFGVFYPARGIGDITSAIGRLKTFERDRIMLHIFTDKPDDVSAAVRNEGLDGCVRVNSYLPYLEFLNLSTKLDWLIVSDARAAEHHDGINPYLPSKYSDYLGSGSRIWALVEHGSALDTLPVAAKTYLGESGNAERFLRSLALGFPAGATAESPRERARS